jgi:cyclic pyranopterin phosphate synthase
MGDFSHLSRTGDAALVDVSAKQPTRRIATVEGRVTVSQACAAKLGQGAADEIRRTARLAGIQAAKQTSTLIPLCHQVPLTRVDVDIGFLSDERSFILRVTSEATAVTGVEMEALCAASIAGATIYDMIKAVDPAAVVGPFRLVEKLGGKNGPWHCDGNAAT